jgi:ABC-type sugar transport system ATPase subunit
LSPQVPGRADAPALLAAEGATRRFGATLALDGADFALRAGEVHALMGENGAGKSTLMKILGGVLRPDAGRILFRGRPVTFGSAADAGRAGIRTVFQELTVLPNLDVARNLFVGREPLRAGWLWLDLPRLYAEAGQILARLGIDLDPRAPVERLSAGRRQMLEIARACAETPRALILDEPTSSLGSREEEILFGLIARLKAEGTGIIYITHRMSEVFRLADRITVLRDGRTVATGPAAGFTRDSLIAAMVGRAVPPRPAGGAADRGPEALRLEGIARGRAVRGVSLALQAGEVLGLAGLMGAGRSETARIVAGIDRPEAGRMTLFGRPHAPASIAAAMAAGVAYLPEDRKTEGLVLPLSVAANIALPNLGALGRGGLVLPSRIAGLARDWMARLGVKAAGPDVAVSALSGGNQQKVALARWLARQPRLVLLDEPTRGVDVGAKAEIHALIRQLAAEGVAVLVISSELTELMAVADRIAVMAAGRIAGEMPAAEATEEALLALAFGQEAA